MGSYWIHMHLTKWRSICYPIRSEQTWAPPPPFFSRTLLYLLWRARRGNLWVWPRPGYEGSSEMKTQSQKYLKNIYRSNRRKNNSVSLHHKNIYRSNREKLLGLSILHKYLQPSHYVLSIYENMGNTFLARLMESTITFKLFEASC